tara:strand:- start:1130 stop:1723 length:594 start_codon:yes stop_codon:yes gene_type:complete
MANIHIITPEVNLYGRQTGIDDTPFYTFKRNKDYMKNLRNYILNVIKEDFEDNYNLENPSEENLMKHFIDRFESEFNHDYNKRIYPRIHRRIENYLLGLAYNFVYTYHKQTEQAIKFHNIKFGQVDEAKEYQWGYRKVTGKTINSWNEKSMRKHLYDMVSYSSGESRNTSNYYFQMITQEIIKLLKKHKLYTKTLSL